MWVGGVRVVIVDEKKNVLMLRQCHGGKDIWMLPGGMIEKGENAQQAAIREVKEETGLDVRIGALLWHVEETSETRGQRFVNFFLASVEGGVLALGFDPERKKEEQVMKEVRFMSRDEIASIDAVYPEYLKNELWPLLKHAELYNHFKIRRNSHEMG